MGSTAKVVRKKPTCHISCGVRKMQKARQSMRETGPRIMVMLVSAR